MNRKVIWSLCQAYNAQILVDFYKDIADKRTVLTVIILTSGKYNDVIEVFIIEIVWYTDIHLKIILVNNFCKNLNNWLTSKLYLLFVSRWIMKYTIFWVNFTVIYFDKLRIAGLNFTLPEIAKL